MNTYSMPNTEYKCGMKLDAIRRSTNLFITGGDYVESVRRAILSIFRSEKLNSPMYRLLKDGDETNIEHLQNRRVVTFSSLSVSIDPTGQLKVRISGESNAHINMFYQWLLSTAAAYAFDATRGDTGVVFTIRKCGNNYDVTRVGGEFADINLRMDVIKLLGSEYQPKRRNPPKDRSVVRPEPTADVPDSYDTAFVSLKTRIDSVISRVESLNITLAEEMKTLSELQNEMRVLRAAEVNGIYSKYSGYVK